MGLIVLFTKRKITRFEYAQSVIENPYAEEAEARWATEYRASVKRFGLLSDDEQAAAIDLGERVRDEIAELYRADATAYDPRVQELVGQHYGWVCIFWTPNREQYIGLGEMYSADPRFTEYYDKKANGLAEFVGKAIRVWAEANL